MANESPLPLEITGVDLSRLVKFTPDPNGSYWISAEGSGRRGQVGRSVGILSLLHSPGYEVVLQMQDGSISTFAPHALLPLSGGRDDD